MWTHKEKLKLAGSSGISLLLIDPRASPPLRHDGDESFSKFNN